MQVNVIHANSPLAFDMLVTPEQNPMNNLFISNQFANISNNLSDIGRKFMDTSRALYEKLNDSTAIRAAKMAIRMAKGVFHPNTIVQINSLEELQSAQPVMQRYIMAEPTIRELYHQQKCDGYSDTYYDIYPGLIRAEHYDWRRVMDGIVEDTVDENGNPTWEATTFAEDLAEGDKELTFEEQADIISTWDTVRMFVNAGKDPTSIFNDELGC